jgi:2',3'-cyclic-nucleotide 2'-phosphodiesterase (5'-nucleotidase family)
VAPDRTSDERAIDRAWAGSGRWALLILPPPRATEAEARDVPLAGDSAVVPLTGCDALVDDALRETYGADFAFGNLAGVRAPLLRGPITRGDLVTLDPFTNTVVTFTMTGREILSVLKRYSPTVSGIRYRMRDGELEEVTIGGNPVDESRTFKGVTNSYFSGTRLRGMKVQDTGRVRLDVLIEYIRKKGTVQPAYDGRRVIVGRAPGAYR